MALGLERTQLQIKKTGTTVTVPSDPRAKLMYYVKCVCSCVEVENDSQINRLKDYQSYWRLTNEEEGLLFALCLTLSPDKLIGSIFIPSDKIDSGNEFIELSAIKSQMVVSDSFLIGGQQKRVQKIMLFKMNWMETFYFEPLRSIQSSRSRARQIQQRQSSGSSCVIS